MTQALFAEFTDGRQLANVARAAQLRHYRLLDAFAPHPLAGLADLQATPSSRIRVAMFVAGIGVAAASYGAGEYYTAVVNYAYNAGARPLDAWPPFMLVPFATGILAAALAGLAMFLFENGLPRLHHSLFDTEGFERASQDRFWLLLVIPESAGERQSAADWLMQNGARSVREVET